MTEKTLPEKVVDKMMKRDGFSQWLGITILSVGEGTCKMKMKVRSEMLNGFDIARCGITYSLADSALAFASNSHGRKSISVETGISHVLSLKEGDTIIAEAEEGSLREKIAIYSITVRKEEDIVALFK